MDAEKSCGIILYVQDAERPGGSQRNQPRFLLLRSTKHGEWGAPKGHIEEEETEQETAVRELFEETGLHSVRFVPGFREVISYNVKKDGKAVSKDAVYFLGKPEDTNIQISSEHNDFHWAILDEIETLVNHEDLREVFRAAHKKVTSSTAKPV